MPAAPRPMTKDEDVVAMRKLTEVTRRRERGIPRSACEQPKERAIDCCCYSGTNRRVSVLSSGTGPVFYFRNGLTPFLAPRQLLLSHQRIGLEARERQSFCIRAILRARRAACGAGA